MVAASILPVAVHPKTNKLLFLFGKENSMEQSAKGWSDFGGGIEKTDKDVFAAAAREGEEETTGILGNIYDLVRRAPANGRMVRLGNPEMYNIHVVPIAYDETLPQHYTNMHKFIWSQMDHDVLGPTKIFEKSEMAWFSESDIRKRIRLFRPFYRDILRDYILPEMKTIRSNLFQKKKSSRRRSSAAKRKQQTRRRRR